ncbi:DNA-binding transcriptional regulator, LysR family [Mucilaginibacter mallensis]|uniref:DNA-binding transcriptional regulator, LysR family n=1 Tax=Mucilaginibacter mallensis TaxID=652787 RepID=A0A1H1VYY9_MUCMA|nr:LysR family transcriptional regulator [Mucilaginibacter mallensis]SDS89983.1 DNA-binding transcriptional regulator, LysR family [Mucilaginibacter mallensis]
MFDFRLQVFYTVAKRLNFTKAADELFISQPAVTKHIKELESEFKVSLFERSGNKKISLTPAGETLLQYTGKLFTTYRELEYDMNMLVDQHNGVLHIGASTTVAQYIIPPILAQFHKKFKDIKVLLITGNTEDMEQALLDRNIEIGIIEGISRNPQIKYEEYLQDELVLVSAANNNLIKKVTIKPDELKNYPLLLREPGSGTLDVIAHALKPHHIKLSDLHIEMQLGGSESIKSYVLHSNCLAFLSIHSILKELRNNECRIIDIKGLTVERPFHFIQLHGQSSPLAELFIRFARNYKVG